MSVEPGYPITMIHPQHKAAEIATGNMKSVPEQFPGVTVNGALDESKYRAQGYLRFGEPQPIAIDHHEYPKMMRHPDHEDEIPSRMEAKYEDNRIVGSFRIPTVPAKFPDIIVNNIEEEENWLDKGYNPAGVYNKEALDAVLNNTIDEETYEPSEYPKWENGKLILKDPNEAEKPKVTPAYPRWEDGVLIQDPRFPPAPDPSKYPMWVHKDGIPSKESVLVKTPAEEFRVRKSFAPEDIEPEEIIETKPKEISKNKNKEFSTEVQL